MFRRVFATIMCFIASPSFAFTDTQYLDVNSIAAGGNGIYEFTLSSMQNPDRCGFSGAYVIKPNLDALSRSSMYATLVAAKYNGKRVKVRLDGCTDRPTVVFIWTE